MACLAVAMSSLRMAGLLGRWIAAQLQAASAKFFILVSCLEGCWMSPSNAEERDYRRISSLDKSAIVPHTMVHPVN
jgi:hypothetical protein